MTHSPIQIRFSSYQQAQNDLARAGFQPTGSGFYRQAHSLWQLSKTSDGYSLIRTAAEPDVFEEDVVSEAPGPHAKEHLKMGALDRYGVEVRVGDFVHYSLAGEPVAGRVMRASYGYLDVQLKAQVDNGVPSDLVMVDRRLRVASAGEDPSIGIERESPLHDSAAKDLDSMNLHLNPDKTAALIDQHFSSYGAALADMFDQQLPQVTAASMRKLAEESKGCACKGVGCEDCMGRKATRVATWQSLQQVINRPEDLKRAITAVAAGMRARRVSREANIPLAIAYELRDDLAAIPAREARELFALAKNVRIASIEDKSFSVLAERVGEEFAQYLTDHVLAYRKQALKFQRCAVDQTARDYWKAYYGEYGEQWIREIKRRIKADLVKAALLKQAVDDAAAEYWSNYYGDYGDRLVEEVDRASAKKEVTARRVPMNAGAPAMSLPKPVQHRDIFASANIIAEEQWGGNRVALAKSPSGVFSVLVRSGNAQREKVASTEAEAISEFRKMVYAHCGA